MSKKVLNFQKLENIPYWSLNLKLLFGTLNIWDIQGVAHALDNNSSIHRRFTECNIRERIYLQALKFILSFAIPTIIKPVKFTYFDSDSVSNCNYIRLLDYDK